MARTFAIGDIHGCSDTFNALLENVLQVKKDDKLFLLGDYIDRGPDSKGVIERILKLKDDGYDVTCLVGNHEVMFLNSLEDYSKADTFLHNGGDKTLRSFGVHSAYEVEPIYVNFFRSLQYYALHDRFILVHAGINFNAVNPFEDTESMVWTRRFTVSEAYYDKIVIHGHTPVSLIYIQKSLQDVGDQRKINLDNGCVYNSNEFYGHLCALELGSMRLYLQKNIEK